jgi:hypothetical protein
LKSEVSQNHQSVIDEYFTSEYLLSTFDNNGGENVKPGALDMFRINMTSIIEQMILMQMDLETSAQCINGKLFLLAHSIWLKSHKGKLSSIRNLIESDNANFCVSRRKAYTITKMPKYMTFNLEYGDFFNYIDAGEESEVDFKRYSN